MQKTLAVALVLFGMFIGASAVLVSAWPPVAHAFVPVPKAQATTMTATTGECVRWQVKTATLLMGRSDFGSGWEPFAAQDGAIYLRRCK